MAVGTAHTNGRVGLSLLQVHWSEKPQNQLGLKHRPTEQWVMSWAQLVSSSTF